MTQIKDIIYSNKLDIEDLAHRMKLDINNLQNLDYNTFSQKLKRLDYTIPEQFIMKIFHLLQGVFLKLKKLQHDLCMLQREII